MHKIDIFMTKRLQIALFCLFYLALVGCKDNNSPVFHTDTLDLTVLHEEWLFDERTQQFYGHFEIPEITSTVYNYGNWSICREFFAGTKDAYQIALPTSIFCSDTLSGGKVVYYTQYIDYRLGVGYVDVQLTNSDYIYSVDGKGELIQPEDMVFRLQLMY